jgi:hypothetical protein
MADVLLTTSRFQKCKSWVKDTRRRLHKHPISVLSAGVSAGIFTGALAHWMFSQQGICAFLTFGGCLGLVFAAWWLVSDKSRRLFSLTEIKITVPQLSEMTFSMNCEYRLVAWKLFVEIMTRISTQPLAADGGFIREALNSLYSLFTTTRELLKCMKPTPTAKTWTVEMLGMQMLNKEMRPFLAKWHSFLKKYEESASQAVMESDWPLDQECRRDLENLRMRLIAYARAFGQLADVQCLDELLESHGQEFKDTKLRS